MPHHPASFDPFPAESPRPEDLAAAQLTAFVLGELPDTERADWERKVAESADLQAEAKAIREAASQVFAALQSEPTPKLSDEQRARIMELARARGKSNVAMPRVVSVPSSEPAKAPSRWAVLATIGVLSACLLLIVTAANDPRRTQLADVTNTDFIDAKDRLDDLAAGFGFDPLHLAESESALTSRVDSGDSMALTRTPEGDVVLGRFYYFKSLEPSLPDASVAVTELYSELDFDSDGVADRRLHESLTDLSRPEDEVRLGLQVQTEDLPQQLIFSEQELDRLSREQRFRVVDGENAEVQLDVFPESRQGFERLNQDGRGVDVYMAPDGSIVSEQQVRALSVTESAPIASFSIPQLQSEAEGIGMVTTSPVMGGGGALPSGTSHYFFDYSGDGAMGGVPSDDYLQTPLSGAASAEGLWELNEWYENSGTMAGQGQPGSSHGTGRPLGTGGGYIGGRGGFDGGQVDVDRFYSADDFGVNGNGLIPMSEQMPFQGFGFRGVVPPSATEEAGMPSDSGLPAVTYQSDDVQFFPAGPETQLPRSRRVHEEYRALQRAGRGEALAWGTQPLSWDDGEWSFEQAGTESYAPIVENPFKSPMEEPMATLGIDVDTASYSNLQRFIAAGQWPPADAVRIEELLNSFTYDYPQPADGEPFSVTMEVAACPWQPEHRLMRVGMQARDVDLSARPTTSLVFLIDVSGSMSDADKLPLVQQSLKLLLEQMTENDRLAIVTYRDIAQVALQSVTGDRRAEAISVVDSLHAEGSTNGAGGLQLAYEVATTNFIREGQNRVIICTDGDFNVGESSDDAMVQLIEQKRETGVFLSVFGFGEGNLQDSKLEGIADHGNGQYAYINDFDQARRKFLDELTGTLYTVAKDVKLQVEFNPLLVRGYRLIGYENRVLAAEDFNNDRVDAGDIGAGHTVTALFEIVPGSALGEVAPSVDPLRYQRVDPVPSEEPAGTTESLEGASEQPAAIPRFYRFTTLEAEAAADTVSTLLGSEVAVEAKDATLLQIETTVENHTQVVEALRQLGEEPQVSVAWQIDHQEQVVVPAEVAHELCVVKIRYKQPTSDESVRRDFPVDDRNQPMTAPTRDFHWASAVAGYGMLVRQSPHRGDISWNAVIEIAHGARGDDADGRRAEFVTLAQQTRDLWFRLHGIDNTPQPVSLDSTQSRDRAACGGKYSNLLDKIEASGDFDSYGNFHDFGWWEGTEYQGHTGLPPAYWVYVHPHWYLWGEMNGEVSELPNPTFWSAPQPEDITTLEGQLDATADFAVVEAPAEQAEPIDVMFTGTDVSIETIQGLAGQRIATLTLMNAQFDGAIIEGLRHTASIEALRLYGDGLSGQLARLAHITGLTRLEIGAPLRLLDLEAISELQGLRHLKLPQELAITVTGARNIAKLRGLTSLDLYNCQLDDASFSELYPLQQLTELDLSLTQVSDVGLPTLTYFPQLKTLRLDRNWMTQARITDSIAPTLASLTELETLSLWGTHIGNDGLVQLAVLPNLKSLSIGQSQITGDGLAPLTVSTIENLTLSPEQVGTLYPGDPLLIELTPELLQEMHQRELEEHYPASPVGEPLPPGESGGCDDPPAATTPPPATPGIDELKASLAAQMPGLMHLRQMPRLKSVLVIGEFHSQESLAIWTALVPHVQWGFIDP